MSNVVTCVNCKHYDSRDFCLRDLRTTENVVNDDTIVGGMRDCYRERTSSKNMVVRFFERHFSKRCLVEGRYFEPKGE